MAERAAQSSLAKYLVAQVGPAGTPAPVGRDASGPINPGGSQPSGLRDFVRTGKLPKPHAGAAVDAVADQAAIEAAVVETPTVIAPAAQSGSAVVGGSAGVSGGVASSAAASAAATSGATSGLFGALLPAGLSAGGAVSAGGAMLLVGAVGGGGSGGGSVGPTVTNTGTSATNLMPVLTGLSDVTFSEDSRPAMGLVRANDPDGDSSQLVFALKNGPAGFKLNADGSYTFDTAEFETLEAGARSAVQTVDYTVTDENGGLTNGQLRFTVVGVNDAPVVTAQVAAQVIQAGGLSATGRAVATDADSGAILKFAVATGQAAVEGLTFREDGTYTFVTTASAYRSLLVGETQQVDFHFMVTDEASGKAEGVLNFVINGVNDRPVGTGDTSSLVSRVMASSASMVVTATDPDRGQTEGLRFEIVDVVGVDRGLVTVGSDGELVLNATSLFSGDAFTKAGGGVEFARVSVKYRAFDADGAASDTLTHAFILTGENDTAVIGNLNGQFVEDSGSATGQLTIADADIGENIFRAISSKVGEFGAFSLDAQGKWTYTVAAANAAVQALGAGQTAADTFDVVAKDGTTGKLVISIQGLNDAAVISGNLTGTVVEAGGVNDAQTGAASADGKLKVSDDDANQSRFSLLPAESMQQGRYGVFVLDATGQWTYILDNADEDTRRLRADESAVETFTVTSVDGTTRNVAVTVIGSNDEAVIGGDLTGVLNAAVNTTRLRSGALTIADDDAGEASFRTVTEGISGFDGLFTLSVDGLWSYEVNFDSAAVRELGAGEVGEDRIRVLSLDGTESFVVVSIIGVNDAVVINRNSIIIDEEGINLIATDIDVGDLLGFKIKGSDASFGTVQSGQISRFSAKEQASVVLAGMLQVADSIQAVDSGVAVWQGTATGESIAMQAISGVVYAFGGNDTVTGSDGSDTILGGAGNDVLTGNAGNDLIRGGDNDDVINGGSGSDSMDGGAGVDTLSFEGHASGVSVSLLTGVNNAGDVLINFENVFGTSLNDSLTGSEVANRLSGNEGNDMLLGEGGNDTLVGGAGVDMMTGGTGADVYGANDFGNQGSSIARSGQQGPNLFTRGSYDFVNGLDQVFGFSSSDGDKLDVFNAAVVNQLSNFDLFGGLAQLDAGEVYVAYGQWDEARQRFTFEANPGQAPAGTFDALVMVAQAGTTASESTGWALLHDINQALSTDNLM